jgi:predicted phosphodiesterase
MLRFMAVTDIHYGFDSGNKIGSQAPRLVERFVRAANENRVDFAVDLGDRVIFKNPEQDRYYLERLKEHFNKCAVPKFSVHGNHDLWHLSRAELAEILGSPGHSYSRDINGHHIIFWNPEVIARGKVLRADDSDLNWLERDLSKTALPVVLLNHIPLDNHAPQDITESKHPHFSYYRNGPDIRAILEKSDRVRLCIAGHRHRSQISLINGIPYVTQQSLTQRIARKRRPYGAFAMYEIDETSLKISGYGIGQKSYNITYTPA